MSLQKRSMLYMLLCAVLWSTSGLFTKLLPWSSMAILCGRGIATAIVLGGYMLLTKRKFIFNRYTLLLGADVAVIFLFYLPAVKLTTAANAIVLQYTAPIYVLIFSALFFKQKPRSGDIIAVIVTVAGVILFFFDQLGGGSLLGTILALISGVFLGFMFLITGRISEEERLSGLFLAQVFSAIIGLPFLFIHETQFSAQYIGYIAFLGIFQLGIPYILYIKAARHCPPFQCSLISTAEPLLNPVWVFLVLGEKPGTYALLGGAVVLLAVTYWNVWSERIKQKEALLTAQGNNNGL